MEGWGLPDEIMRKVSPSEIFKVDCTKLPPQALFSGQGFAFLEVLQQLRPAELSGELRDVLSRARGKVLPDGED